MIDGDATGRLVWRGSRAHACNCIGCCRACGQCRTTPWHPHTCSEIARLEAEKRAVIEDWWSRYHVASATRPQTERTLTT